MYKLTFLSLSLFHSHVLRSPTLKFWNEVAKLTYGRKKIHTYHQWVLSFPLGMIVDALLDGPPGAFGLVAKEQFVEPHKNTAVLLGLGLRTRKASGEVG